MVPVSEEIQLPCTKIERTIQKQYKTVMRKARGVWIKDRSPETWNVLKMGSGCNWSEDRKREQGKK